MSISVYKQKLGKTNYLISKIGLGTVQFGLDYGFTKKKSQEEVNEILDCAMKHGINFIDTAREYGDSEKKIGRYITDNKNNLIVATKLKKIKPDNITKLKDYIYKSIEDSLSDLKLIRLDIIQLHQSEDFLMGNDDFWRIIDDLKSEKIIGAFGISVYEINETLNLIENTYNLIDFFQVPFNIFDRRFIEIEKLANKKSISLISRSTFLKGVITCETNNLPVSLARLKPYKEKLIEISKRLSLNIEELALLFVYSNDLIISTILGVDSAKELESNANTIDKYLNYKNKILNEKEIDNIIIKDLDLIDPRRWSDF